MITLWVITSYLLRENSRRFASLITALPAAFMTAVCITYILMADEGLRLSQMFSCITGLTVAAILLCVYFVFLKKRLRRA